MNIVSGHYNLWIVSLSFLIASLASYVALSLTKKISRAEGSARFGWIAAGSVVMGCGIWTMHFLGMMAFHLPVTVMYDVPVTILSLALAILAAFIAFGVTAVPDVGKRRLLAAGACMSVGITGMHYTGMAAMRFHGRIAYDPALWALSALVALVVSYAALYLFLRFRRQSGLAWHIVCAAIMGAAICGMHYTGMAAAGFHVDPAAAHQVEGGGRIFLMFGIALTMLVVLGVSWSALFFDRHVLERMAFSDPLTGLPNRNLLNRSFEGRLKENGDEPFAVMFLDLDRFKTINDTLGHDVGDQLILEVSRRLEACLAPGQTAFRLGGDEFFFILPGANRKTAELLAVRLLHDVKQPYVLEGHELFITASVGVSFAPDHGTNRSQLMKTADTAMYEAKTLGKNRYVVFDNDLGKRLDRNMRLEKDMRRAMVREEFFVVYQPKWHSGENRPIGMEALVRWRHPELGVVSPTEFIPIAEETGIVIPMTRWVMQEACRQVSAWRDEGLADVGVSVNLSVRLFESQHLVHMVEAILDSSGLPPAALELEITESLLLYDVRDIVVQLAALRRLGVKIAMDDFGSGYSSLGSLDQLPIDTLKIDQLFIRESGQTAKRAILQAIVTMASQLRIDMVAEGVETEEQIELLRKSGCQVMQGYYYGKPMEKDIMRDWLERNLPRSAVCKES